MTIAATSHLPASLLLAGAGKMGRAMLEGWLATGLDPARIGVVDPGPSDGLRESAGRHGFRLATSFGSIPPADVLVLAIKPQALGDVAPGLASVAGTDTLVVSILAGKTVADLSAALPDARAFIRAMPNLPASVRRGATGAYASPAVTDGQRSVADGLLRAVGIVEWVADEALIDAVTAVSGSGPAYAFHLVECLAEAGREVGLDPGLADRLARETIVGAAELLKASDLPPGRLRENVTSPGGTTAAALDVLMGEGGLGPLMRRAVAAARRRAAELSG